VSAQAGRTRIAGCSRALRPHSVALVGQFLPTRRWLAGVDDTAQMALKSASSVRGLPAARSLHISANQETSPGTRLTRHTTRTSSVYPLLELGADRAASLSLRSSFLLTTFVAGQNTSLDRSLRRKRRFWKVIRHAQECRRCYRWFSRSLQPPLTRRSRRGGSEGRGGRPSSIRTRPAQRWRCSSAARSSYPSDVPATSRSPSREPRAGIAKGQPNFPDVAL
jgi:hypothetical protein